MAEQAFLAMTAQLAQNQRLLTHQVQQKSELLELERGRARRQDATAVDTEGIGKPGNFSGNVDDWRSSEFKPWFGAQFLKGEAVLDRGTRRQLIR